MSSMKISFSENNYRFIDIGKSIAMYFVIIMHCIRDNGNYVFKLVQVGCMAFFFFASGFYIRKNIKIIIFLNIFVKMSNFVWFRIYC